MAPAKISMADGFSVDVGLTGLQGVGKIEGTAVVYQRPRGISLWTHTPEGFEEWLFLKGVERGEVARWTIRGAALHPRGETIELLDNTGRARITVSAPTAFATDGEKLRVFLRVERDQIVLHSDRSVASRVLIDPLWSVTGNFGQPREAPAVMLLTNGKVLVTGGAAVAGPSSVLTSSELYDPATGSFAGASRMNAARMRHNGVLLKSGLVLVAGGFDGTNALQSAEVYDPYTDSWRSVAPMAVARMHSTMHLLDDGRVIVIGGQSTTGMALASAEIFNPVTETWSSTPALPSALGLHVSVIQADGKVFASMGTQAEIYDPSANTWTAANPPPNNHTAAAATRLNDGRILVVSGSTTAACNVFNPATGAWTTTEALPALRSRHSATLLPNGKVLVLGGADSASSPVLSAHLYDPTAGTWSISGSLTSGRPTGHSAILVIGGKVFVTGGAALANELYDPLIGASTATGDMVRARGNATYLVTLANGKVLAAGGEDGSSLTDCDLYDPVTKTWTATTPLAIGRRSYKALLLPSGKAFAIGGYDGSNAFNSTELYDPATGLWSYGGNLVQPRRAFAAALLDNGQVLVAGGSPGSGSLASADLYTPSSDSWAATGGMQVARRFHTATLLYDGKVLVVGGLDGSTYHATSELYDPSTGVWTYTKGSLLYGRQIHTATLLPNRKVLITGGEGATGYTNTTEVYDPETDTFSAGPQLAVQRGHHTAQLLPSGKVMIAGGWNGSTTFLPVDVYDPETGTMATAGSLAIGRKRVPSTLMLSGQVLIAGGESSGGASLIQAEIYDEGRAVAAGTEPVLNGPLATTRQGDTLVLTGSRLTGKSNGSGGRDGTAATSHPVIVLHRQDNQARYFPRVTDWSATSVTIVVPLDLPQGAYQVWAVVNGAASSSLMVNVPTSATGGTARLQITSTAQTVTAGACSPSPLTIQSQTLAGVALNVSANTSVQLAPYPGLSFYSDATCATPIAAAVISSGTSSTSVYFRGTTVGSTTVTVGANSYNSASQVQTIQAGAPSQIAFTSNPVTVAVNTCSPAVVLQVADSYGNPSNVPSSTAVTLSGTGLTFFSNPTCTTSLTSPTVAGGSSSLTFYFTGSTSGAIALEASSSYGSATQTETITGGAPTKIAFTTGSQTVVANTGCSALVTIQSQNTLGLAANATAAITLTPSGNGLTFYTNSACTKSGSFTIDAGANTASFYFTGTIVGLQTLTVTPSAGLTAVTQQESIVAAAVTPTKIAFATVPQTVAVDGCSGVTTVQAQNAGGSAGNVSANTTVTLSAPSTTFYSNSGCTAVVTSVLIPNKYNAANFYFRTSAAGTVVLTASTSTLGSATQSETIGCTGAMTDCFGACVDLQTNATYCGSCTTSCSAGQTCSNGACQGGGPAATQLAFTTPSRTFTAATCAGAANAIAVQLQDASGNPVNAGAGGQTFTASSTSTGTVTWHTDSSCSTVASGGNFTIASGSSTVNAYYRDTKAGTPSVSLSNASSLTNPSPQNHAVVADVANRLAFTTPSRTFTAATCAGAANVIAVQLQDASGNPVNAGAGGQTFTASSTSTGTVTWYTDSSCSTVASGGNFTIASGSSTVNVYYRDTKAGTPSVSLSNASSLTNPTAQTHTMTAGTGNQLAFTSPARTFTAGSCGGAGRVITVQLQDASGNPLAADTGGQAFTAASDSTGTVTWYTDATCMAVAPGGNFTIAAGTNTASLFYADTLAGNPSIGVANASGLANPPAQTQAVTAASASRLAFTTPSRTFSAGTCPGAGNVITVALTDAFDNPVAAGLGGQAFTAATSSTGTVNWYTDATCATPASGGNFTIASGASSVSVFYRDVQAGSPSISLSNGAGLLNPSPQTHTVSVLAPSKLAFTSSPQTLAAGQCSPAPVVVQVQDNLGNGTSSGGPRAVGLAATNGTLGFFSDVGCTQAVGGVTVASGDNTASFYFRDTAAGSPQLTATTMGLSPAQQTQSIQPAPAAVLAFASAPETVAAGVCSGVVVVETLDVFGNVAQLGMDSAVTLSSTSTGNGFYADSNCNTALVSPSIALGASSLAFHFRDTRAGAPTLTAESAPLAAATQQQTVQGGAATGLVISGLPVSAEAGTPVNFTVTAVDAFGNPASGYTGTVSFSSSSLDATLPGQATFTGTQSSQNFSVTFSSSGPASLTVTDGALSATQSGVQVNSAPAATFVLSGVSSPSLVGDASSLAVELLDAFGNRVTGYQGTVRFTSSDASALLPPDFTFTAAQAGLHIFPVRLMTPGTQSLAVRDMAVPLLTGTLSPLVVRQMTGGACAAASDCASSFCVDGVCCQTSCTGSCASCSLSGSVGICAPVPDGSSCEDASYCNGRESCQAGSCQGGAPVACVDAFGRDVLVCQEATQSCEVVPNSPPVIVHDANLAAGVGNAYVYNVLGAMRVAGARPMSFSACGGPVDFGVDALSGAVHWTPSTSGPVALCLKAQNAYGVNIYSFAVQVGTPVGAGPVANFTATPVEGRVPLQVAFDGSASIGATSVVLYGWQVLSGVSPLSGVTQSFTYSVPGTYRPALTVTDSFGRQASARRAVTVLGPSGQRPPSALIAASQLQGAESLTVDFGCDCQPGDAPLAVWRWEIGGSVSYGPNISQTFTPGRYRIRLTVVDEAGFSASDAVDVVVSGAGRQPPTCGARATPAFDAAPVEVVFSATANSESGDIASISWRLSDGSEVEGLEARQVAMVPGHYAAVLQVVDDAGLSCVDTATALVTDLSRSMPIRIERGIGEHLLACDDDGAGTSLLPVVSGDGPLVWSIEPLPGEPLPEGVTVDAQTGQLFWTSLSEASERTFLLRVSGQAGTDIAKLHVNLHCDSRIYQVGCGCSAESAASDLWLPIALLALRLRRRHRGRRSGPAPSS
ncbi:MAG: kelch repeat-containing protein [Myxococcaceae bacterium]